MKTLVWGLLCCALGVNSSPTPANKWSSADVQPLTALNSPAADYLPTVERSGKLIYFVSNRQTDLSIPKANGTTVDVADNSDNVWIAQIANDGSYENMSPTVEFSHAKIRDGGVSFGKGKVSAVFAVTDWEADESYGKSDIYTQTSKRPNAETVVLEYMNAGAEVNSSYNDETPTLAPDGTLYFSSDRPGGQGGRDIWFCRYNSKTGKWLPAENAGPVINTAGDEIAPALSPDGALLVFASTGHKSSMGGYDLFECALSAPGKATKPINLGGNINSPADEVSACFAPSGTALYFASDRNKATGLDLYKAQLH